MSIVPLGVVASWVVFAAAACGSTVNYTQISPVATGCSFAFVGTCTVDPTNAQVYSGSVASSTTGGAQMGGMTVQVIYSDGFTETLTWASTGSGGVADAAGAHRWSLTNTADTFTNVFTLTNAAASTANITDIILSGVGGVNAAGQGTIFDRVSNPDSSTAPDNSQTPNSRRGHDLTISSGTLNTYNITVTYSHEFSVTSTNACSTAGSAPGSESPTRPCGDEWAQLGIHFNSGPGIGAFTPNSTFAFIQDTDNTNNAIATPEPSTFALLGMGLLAGAYWRRRRSLKATSRNI